MYYNTNRLQGNTLREAHVKAKTQEEKILEFFQSNINLEASPETVQILVFDNNRTPLTSIRRAMTNLTERGKLFKTDKMEVSMYGKPAHLWRLKIVSRSFKYVEK
jgi:hypothetical protein